MYLPQSTALYLERMKDGNYRVICGEYMTVSPWYMVDGAVEVLVGDDYFYNLNDD